MGNRKKFFLSLLFIICYLLFDSPLFAFDAGLTLDQNVNYSSDAAFAYNGLAIPRLSGLMGNIGEFYFSAGINFHNNPWSYAPELLRAELFWSQGGLELSLGRIPYSDPLGYIVSGLFDGEQFSFHTEAGSYGFGAWYTGFIYKKRINIEMTAGDKESNDSAGYFAPSRILAAIDWEHQGIGELVYARLSLLGQFDPFGAELYSQYIIGKLIVPFKVLAFSLGGCLEFMETPKNKSMAFAAEFGATLRAASQGLSLLARYSSAESGSMAAFLPVTANAQGQILKAKLSGLSMVSLDYTARLARTFTVSLTPTYFFLSDFKNASGNLLGAELFGAFYWSPLPDVSVNLGGGAFLPSFGNVTPEGKAIWRVELNLVLSLL